MHDNESSDNSRIYLLEKFSLHGMTDITEMKDGVFYFSFKENKYAFLFPENIYQMPKLVAIEYDKKTHPHFYSLVEDNSLHGICLNIIESYIVSDLNISQKIDITFDKFLKLHDLSQLQIKKEFDAEFKAYWNISAKETIFSFLTNADFDRTVNLYIPKEKSHPIVVAGKSGYKDRFYSHIRTAIYIEIRDFRSILPPTAVLWDKVLLQELLFSARYSRINPQTSDFLEKLIIKENVTLILKLPISNSFLIGLKLTFKNTDGSYLKKKMSGQVDIELINVKPSTMECSLIRNGSELLKIHNIALIGAGSLGSYLFRELTKTNLKNITLIDKENFDSDNLSRHSLGFNNIGRSKVFGLEVMGMWNNPLLTFDSIKLELNYQNIAEILGGDKGFDCIFITTGNEDLQKMINEYLLENSTRFIPTFFCWLEPNGIGAHVFALVNFNQSGCYNCLQLAKKNEKKYIFTPFHSHEFFSNGCGGVYSKYGTNILLETTSMILKVLNDFSKGKVQENCVYSLKSITNEIDYGTDFYNNQQRGIDIYPVSFQKGCDVCG